MTCFRTGLRYGCTTGRPRGEVQTTLVINSFVSLVSGFPAVEVIGLVPATNGSIAIGTRSIAIEREISLAETVSQSWIARAPLKMSPMQPRT